MSGVAIVEGKQWGLIAKKIVPPQSFVALYLGKELTFLITEVEAENVEQ